MFDTATGKFEKGPYLPKDASRNSWELRTREFFDAKLSTRQTVTSQVFSRPEARIALFGDGGILQIEASPRTKNRTLRLAKKWPRNGFWAGQERLSERCKPSELFL
jgi:hypothetical protein